MAQNNCCIYGVGIQFNLCHTLPEPQYKRNVHELKDNVRFWSCYYTVKEMIEKGK